MTFPDEAGPLFRVEPKAFVAARNELAAKLRAEGRDADADAVKALRKPTVIVWALDQLADRDADGVEALLDAGRELRAAQRATLSSKAAGKRLRDATAARREVVARLTEVAVTALGEVGAAGRTRSDAIAAALESASLDDEVAARPAAGTLDVLPDEPAGFGEVFGLTAIEGGVARSRSRGSSNAPDLARLRRDRDSAARAERASRDEAERLARELAELRERVKTLEPQYAEAEARAHEKSMEAKRAERALAKAERGGGDLAGS